MKIKGLFRTFIVTSGLFVSAHAYSGEVLVYNGPGNCTEGCAAAAARIVQHRKMGTRYISPSRLSRAALANAKIWIQPGGDAIEMANTLTPAQKRMLQDFIREGGTYIGFCAGAFLADSTVDDANTVQGLGLLMGTTYDYLPDLLGKAVMLPIQWGQQLRNIYFEDGPGFRMQMGARFVTLAVYPDGSPAVMYFRYGRGKVILSGVHPESPVIWKQATELEDPDGDDMDLAHELVEIALNPAL